MKHTLTFLVAVFFCIASIAQNADYLLKKDFQGEKKKISESIDAAKKTGMDAKKIAAKQFAAIDSLTRVIEANQKLVVRSNDSLLKMETKFMELEARMDKKTSSSQTSLFLVVFIFGAILVFLLSLVFYFKNKSDEKFRELNEEDLKLGEAVKQEVELLRAETKKSVDSISLEYHEHAANLFSTMELTEERQRQFALELEEVVDKIVKEQNLQKSSVETLSLELKSEMLRKTEHLPVHEKLETEVKGLKTLHLKDIEELKAKI
jgi:hypothetical protein